MGVKLEDLTARYGATYFRNVLSQFVVQLNHPEYTSAQRACGCKHVFQLQQNRSLSQGKVWLDDPHGFALPGSELRDIIHCRPMRTNKRGDDIDGHFNTALVHIPGSDVAGIHRELNPFLLT